MEGIFHSEPENITICTKCCIQKAMN